MILPYVHVDETEAKGRGMFTDKFIPADKLIETAPVIIMSGEERKLLDQTLLHDYIFEWTPDGENGCCMAQGYISVYNHSYTSNCEYFMNYEDKTISIKAVRDIEAGEELTINYNGDWNDEKPVWFDVK
ncbi:MAG: SET domain-containing protein-lysine N-methyltransferase [Bacteroidetes bacterium]|nr:SET domain-containing protein-lysine N-methyltransferase [Bacteroidota bacterium]